MVYKPEANNPNSLGGVFITALFKDRSGALWIGVDQGLDRFDPVTEIVHPLPFQSQRSREPGRAPGAHRTGPGRNVVARPRATDWIGWIRFPAGSPTIATIRTIPESEPATMSDTCSRTGRAHSGLPPRPVPTRSTAGRGKSFAIISPNSGRPPWTGSSKIAPGRSGSVRHELAGLLRSTGKTGHVYNLHLVRRMA